MALPMTSGSLEGDTTRTAWRKLVVLGVGGGDRHRRVGGGRVGGHHPGAVARRFLRCRRLSLTLIDRAGPDGIACPHRGVSQYIQYFNIIYIY